MRVGLVGCGFAARTRHLPALADVAEVDPVALADTDRAALAETGDAFGIARRYGAAAELFHDPGVDAVAICVPAAAHVDLALAAIESGKHVLVEKPLALSLEDAERLLAGAETTAVKVMVGLNLRHHRLVRQARDALRAGAIGPIAAVHTVYSDPILDRADLPDWRSQRAAGGGALFEKAVHHFDLWRMLLGDEVDEVAAVGRAVAGDDQDVSVLGRTTAGVLVQAFVSDRTATTNQLTVFGEDGALFLDLYRSDGLRLVGKHDLPGAVGSRLRRMLQAARQLGANAGEIRTGGVFDASYRSEWQSFARAIRDDGRLEASLDDGYRSLELVLAVLRSLASGEPVRVGGRSGHAAAHA